MRQFENEIVPSAESGIDSADNADLSEDRRELIRNFETTRYILEKDYGVGDLSTIEGVRLREILEECLREADKQGEELLELTEIYEDLREKEDGDSENLRKVQRRLESLSRISFDPKRESIARWLYELYAIPLRDIPYEVSVTDKTTGETFGFVGYYSPRSMEEIANNEDDADRIDNFFVSDEAAEKMRELKGMGHETSCREEAGDAFREHLRRVRENAHLITSATPRRKATR